MKIYLNMDIVNVSINFCHLLYKSIDWFLNDDKNGSYLLAKLAFNGLRSSKSMLAGYLPIPPVTKTFPRNKMKPVTPFSTTTLKYKISNVFHYSQD